MHAKESGEGGRHEGAPGTARDPLAELDQLIGLEQVKEQVRKLVDTIELGRERERRGMPPLMVSHQLVFTGNAGTGKTAVARIVGQIYKDIGLLKSGHLVEAQRADLVAAYIGQTAAKTQAVIDRALDGVLLIDEAYSLAPTADEGGDFGFEAIATLMKAMEDNPHRLVVFLAGYKEEMSRFMDRNRALKPRFGTVIDFPDYDAETLFRIFVQNAKLQGVRLSVDAQIAVQTLMGSLDTERKGSGNARTVRNIFDECLKRQAGRLARGRDKVDVTMFEGEDIPKPGEMSFD